MPPLKDLTGERFGKLTVLGRDKNRICKKRYVYWICQCDCGTIKSVESTKLKTGRTKTCGCGKTDRFYKMSHTEFSDFHNKHRRLYKIWHSMNDRCYNENHKSYKNYGGRGISVCNDWRKESGFSNFVNWSYSNGYGDKMSIDRIDNSANYSPENCRWITIKEQQRNKTNNRLILFNGQTKPLCEWCEIYGITSNTLRHRLDILNLPFDVAVTMDSVPTAINRGTETKIKDIAHANHIDYKQLLRAILVEHEDVEHAISRLKTIDSMERMMQSI